MCLILLAYHYHPEYPLIMAANRDEFYQRPTAPAAFWDDYPDILAGRDLEKMGTWLGISRKGRVGAVTNYRGLFQTKAEPRSRGELVTNFLVAEKTPEDYLEELRQKRVDYHGFNLLIGDHKQMFYYSNVSDKMELLTPGIHGLSNAFLNTPWPKVVHGKRLLEQTVLKQKKVLDPESFFSILALDKPFPDEELPDTGVGIEWERTLSPLFITSSNYGTRSSTLIWINKQGDVHFQERSFSKGGKPWGKDRIYTFTI